ncbi:MAG: ectonucleotide pyrophosphatase/phosphodiesterase [Cephaloticoccus sp.]
MKAFRLFCLLGAGFCAFASTRAASPAPIVILISIDGGRWDYLQKYAPPTLNALAAHGVRAERMVPCFPSSTFPNHYTLVTGLRPEHHGIVSNAMYDPALDAEFAIGEHPAARERRWWGGEPVWVTAAKQGVPTATLFWPGSEAEINGGRPERWKRYDGSWTSDQRTDQVLQWLQLSEPKRPRLITLYFDIVDGAGHAYGPDSSQTREAVLVVDQAIGRLVAGVSALGLAEQVNYVVVADHGMTDVNAARRIALDDFVDPQSVQIDFSGYLVGLRPRDGDVERLFQKFAGPHPHFQAWKREEIPAGLHYRNHLRIPPLVLVPDPGWLVLTQDKITAQDRDGWTKGGAHGYDPSDPDMSALFVAAGPAFRSGLVVAPFENIHVYDMLCTLIGVQPAPNDGDHRLAFQILRP